jgi:hypothetical protein
MTFFKDSRQPEEGEPSSEERHSGKFDGVTLFARAIGEASPMPFHVIGDTRRTKPHPL